MNLRNPNHVDQDRVVSDIDVINMMLLFFGNFVLSPSPARSHHTSRTTVLCHPLMSHRRCWQQLRRHDYM